MTAMRNQRREGRRSHEAWESWPLVDGADTVDVVGPDLFRRFLMAAKEVASDETQQKDLDKADVAFCREVATYADDVLLTSDLTEV
jgi:hypothetical protein